MGKKGFKGKNRRGPSGGGGGGGGGGRRERGANTWRDYPALKKENARLQEFYDSLLKLSDEEKEQFWEAFRRELPNSFRFCGSKEYVHAGLGAGAKAPLAMMAVPSTPPQAVPWYPNELAWWMTTPKNVVRKFPPFAAFQKFLVSETSVGNISRQEVVSMIPPMLMDVRPGMAVLDMCAAPGSKSAQLLEMLHVGEEARMRKILRTYAKGDGLDLGEETREEVEVDLAADPSDDGRATGLLIANDADYKRGHLLVHQLKRLSSPNLLVTNHDATQFPSIRLPQPDPKSNKPVYLKFDRILADVPCSGDGTTRKNANIWKDWQPGNALGLHITQIRILVRALQLLKVGGRVVYSTCSMNPIENESIIAAAIDRCGGLDNVEILDCSDKLPGLIRKPGLKTWQIMDKSGRIWNSWEEVEAFAKESADGVIPGRVVPTMFAKSGGSDLPLERCMRVYPHLQDTGAFFITVLEKKAEFKAKNENEPRAASEENATTESPVAEARREDAIEEVLAEVKKEDAVEEAVVETKKEGTAPEAAPEAAEEGSDAAMDDASVGGKRSLEADEIEEQPAKKAKTEGEGEGSAAAATATTTTPAPPKQDDRPGKARRNGPIEEPFKYLDPSHPIIEEIKKFYSLSSFFPNNRYMVRNEMGEPAKAIYYTTALTRDILTENEGRGIKFIHGGVRMFMKQDAPSAEVCRWRIQAEGMPILQGYVGEPRVVHLRKKETLHRLLIEMFPKITDGGWQKFEEIGERVRDIGMGCCVLRIEPDGTDPEFTERMALPLWKSFHSLNLMLPKEDRAAMLLRIFNDTSPLINISLKNQKRAGAAQGVAEEEEEQQEQQEANEGDGIDVEDLPSPEETAVEESEKQEEQEEQEKQGEEPEKPDAEA
ncbi:Multisite-specific tRNA:(cytosine-C(5))-methyltransferase [Escovopsis weberi]|uniref:Multisite-specific tRNA:(Cytosine-C(5))-methyltransferase n=1 Tax=Escovopsis weberi TaxID=150374 RepID=A0A0M8MVR9_ESCWE|nr:Multisite-specific tRNA:(cytosine-C(5))-methyltransferase [Escovopsis weberi]